MASADVARTSLVFALALVVQHTLLDGVRVDGAHPEIMLMVAAAAGYVGGPERGAFVGFFAGLAADLLLPTTFGLSALVGCLLGFATGSSTSGLVRGSRPLAIFVLTTAEVTGLVGFAVLGAVLGLQGAVTSALAPALVVATPAAAVLALPVLALVRWAVPPALPSAATPPPAGLGR
jgi:rod shape-determining protein MreD